MVRGDAQNQMGSYNPQEDKRHFADEVEKLELSSVQTAELTKQSMDRWGGPFSLQYRFLHPVQANQKERGRNLETNPGIANLGPRLEWR